MSCGYPYCGGNSPECKTCSLPAESKYPTGNWTKVQREELIASLREKANEQIAGDPELKAHVDWMIRACELEPSEKLYRLIVLTGVMYLIAKK